MKKVATEPRSLVKTKSSSAVHTNDNLFLCPPGYGMQHAATAELLNQADIYNSAKVGVLMRGCSVNDAILFGDRNFSEFTNDGQPDDIDGHIIVDPLRTKVIKEQYQAKMIKIASLIRTEEVSMEESLSEYLKLTTSGGAVSHAPPPNLRIRQLFEKKNLKSVQVVESLRRKQDSYRKRLKEIDMYGAGPRQAREVLKDVGHGIRRTIVSKPKEFAHLIRNRFGSADDISSSTVTTVPVDVLHDQHGLFPSMGVRHRRKGSGTLPCDFKYHSSEHISSVVTDSPTNCDAVEQLNDVQCNNGQTAGHTVEAEEKWAAITLQIEKCNEVQRSLQGNILALQNRIDADQTLFQDALDEEHYRREHLEEQINDLTELHQNEVFNIKQELSSLEEKMEYQLEEKTRDMQELLESCQTKVCKMETLQQQVISMENFDTSTVKMLVTKLINVFLSLLAVILVLVNTSVHMIGPFLNTRIRCLATGVLAVIALLLWHYGIDTLDKLRHFVF